MAEKQKRTTVSKVNTRQDNIEDLIQQLDHIDEETPLEGLRHEIFLDRYSLKDETGKAVEQTPHQMWKRVAAGIASMEETEEKKKEWAVKFYNTMKDFKFVPGGRILAGAGTGYEVTYYNCYVIPAPKDSRTGIMESVTQTVEIQSRGGGVGFNLSSLRPRGARVKKVNGTSSGPVSWAALYSTANYDVIQQGGSRRGALMIMLHDWHPDVEEFIHVKEDLTKIAGANLSVCVSDSFMEAVKKDSDWDLVFPDLSDPDYDEVWDGDIEKWKKLGKKLVVYKTVKAKELWDEICTAAWRSAEPGLHFLERSNKLSNTWYYERLEATNPCGEQPLPAWAVCNLGAMNLSSFVKDGKFNYESLAENVRVAVRFLDNVIDSNYYFNKTNEDQQRYGTRRTGLGTMGLGDALIKLGIKYGSDESLETIEKIYRIIRDNAYDESANVAKEKGAFPKFDKEKYLQGEFIKRLPRAVQKKISDYGVRNAVVLTQAPTGTTSLLAGVSSGIEPVYDFAIKRTDRTGTHIIYHPLLEEWREQNPNKEVSEKPSYFVGANDLTPEDHVKVQAAVQYYTDSSISKTVNAPNSHTVEDVKRLYMMAYDLGCKGVTYFRDGSRAGVLEHVDDKKEEIKEVPNPVSLRKRPHVLNGKTYRVETPVGSAWICINEDDQGNIFEVFINIGKAGTDVKADAEALGRLISLMFRIPSDYSQLEIAYKLSDQLRGIGGASSMGLGPNRVRSLADGVGKVIAEHIKNGSNEIMVAEPEQETVEEKIDNQSMKDICPSCGEASFVYEEGCSKCYSCGYSKC